MTKTNLVGLLLAVLVLTGFSAPTEAAHAKSATEIAQINNSIVSPTIAAVERVDSRNARRPIRNPENKWEDSGRYDVWKTAPTWIRDLGYCIRKHESIEQGHYKAHNGSSSAAGAYQILDNTWRGNAKWTKFHGKFVAKEYKAANHAPPWIQDLVFIHSIKHGGFHNWSGTHCGYGT